MSLEAKVAELRAKAGKENYDNAVTNLNNKLANKEITKEELDVAMEALKGMYSDCE